MPSSRAEKKNQQFTVRFPLGSDSLTIVATHKGDNVDFVIKFEKALRKKHDSLKLELAKIEGLINAFEKGVKRGAKKSRSRLSAAARRKISLAQKARWAKTRKAKPVKR
jgi:hypothetical protein